MYQLVIFDMDGTILDSLEDLKNSVNFALGSQNMPMRNTDEIRSFVGNGVRELIERSVPYGTSPAQANTVYDAFKSHYAIHCTDYTRP